MQNMQLSNKIQLNIADAFIIDIHHSSLSVMNPLLIYFKFTKDSSSFKIILSIKMNIFVRLFIDYIRIIRFSCDFNDVMLH